MSRLMAAAWPAPGGLGVSLPLPCFPSPAPLSPAFPAQLPSPLLSQPAVTLTIWPASHLLVAWAQP